MKKKSIAILLALLLTLMPASALAKTLTCRNIFSIEYPLLWINYGADDSWDVENEYYDLGFIGGFDASALNIELAAYYIPQYSDVRLFDAEQEIIDEFAGLLLEEYPEGELVEIVYVGDYQIPFIIIRYCDSYGDGIAAETLSNGWNITLDGFAYADESYTSTRELTESDISTFMDVVYSFEPIV